MEIQTMPKPSKPAGLTASLVRKGAATPSAPTAQKAPNQAHGSEYYKAMTLKLDRRRYDQLKRLGLRLDRSSQELLTDALDAMLKSQTGG